MPDHKIRELIDWYLDEDGYPDPDKDGKKRFFYRIDGEFIWGNSKEELGEKTGVPEEDWEQDFFSFSFVSGTIEDNPPMLKANPRYYAALKALNPVDKAQLLKGNWNARPKGASYWERSWIEGNKVNGIPYNAKCARGYDLAATERSTANKTPDPTASIAMAKTREGRFIIYGNYEKGSYDDMYNIYGQYCKRSGARDKQIVQQGHYDGDDVVIVLPLDPGAAGKTAYQEQAKYLSSEGLVPKKDPVPNNKSKLIRFQPFATACENGLVDIWWDSFDDKTRNYIFKQLEAFNGERSTSRRKDDFADAIASVFNYLCTQKVRGKFTGRYGGESNYGKYKEQMNR